MVALVDYQSLITIGLTAAMAWELPFDPFYPEEELPEAYEEGRLPLLQIDFEPEDSEEDESDEDEDDKKNKKQGHRRKDNSTLIGYKSKKKPNKKINLPLPAEWNLRPPIQYFSHRPSPFVNYVQPLQQQPQSPANYYHQYAFRPQQPHPYYTNYGNNVDRNANSPNGYYSSGGGGGGGSSSFNHGYSNKLNYYLSYADKLLREYNAQLNRERVSKDKYGRFYYALFHFYFLSTSPFSLYFLVASKMTIIWSLSIEAE